MKFKTQTTKQYNIDKLLHTICAILPIITIIFASAIFITLICNEISYDLFPGHVKAMIFATILIAIISTLLLADSILSYIYCKQDFIVKDVKTQYFIDDVEVSEKEFMKTQEKGMKNV